VPTNTNTHPCRECGDHIDPRRWARGYKLCLLCGEEHAKEERRHWTVAPMHKSNYVLVTDRSMLIGVNNKQQR
jgi:hypothetical protein